MILDFDDYGCNHVISDQCQSHDCRTQLDALHYANPGFKVTLFAIPGEMTPELIKWCAANELWVELAVHGFYHTSNYEVHQMSYDEFDSHMHELSGVIDEFFVRGFKAPGWQISDGAYEWLKRNGWWIADQSYNNERRPIDLPAYVANGKDFYAVKTGGVPSESDRVEAWHGHTWNCVGNGIEETFEHVKTLVQNADSFQFVSESLA